MDLVLQVLLKIGIGLLYCYYLNHIHTVVVVVIMSDINTCTIYTPTGITRKPDQM